MLKKHIIKKLKYSFILLIIVISVLTLSSKTDNKSADKTFIHAEGNQLVVGENQEKILLQGICFGNEVWVNTEIPSNHHNEKDYQRVKAMGMNVIRFYMNYLTFESDTRPYKYKKSGWEWLDKNIEWAKKNNIYLLLNIHVPQGGFQSNGGGLELWRKKSNQERFIALWKAIAERYKDEKTIAGYDILNEPVVTKSTDQWKNLAKETVKEIRKVDPNHLIVIEQLLGVHGNWKTYHNRETNQFLVDDPYNNIMYDFHYYFPHEYSHQNTSWTGLGEGGVYPDEKKVIYPSGTKWAGFGAKTDNIPSGKTNWINVESAKYTVKNKSFSLAKPVLICKNLKNGVVYFDNFILNEYDKNDNLIRTIHDHDIESSDKWGIWSENNKGARSYSTISKNSGSSSLKVTGTTSNAVCYNNSLAFIPKQGNKYSISGYVKGVNIPANAECCFRLDFENSPSGKTLNYRNKKYLESELLYFMKFGKDNNVPMNVGEFGLYYDCFKNNKGGLIWMEDVLDLLLQYNLNFTYHTYHEYSFGLYRNSSGLPDPDQANDELIELFKKKLN